jgi:hypothetical protein
MPGSVSYFGLTLLAQNGCAILESIKLGGASPSNGKAICKDPAGAGS